MVAVISRTFDFSVSVPPSRSYSRSCSTRSSFTCVARVDVADLVEEQRAALGELEAPFLRACAPVNAPFLVAEQLRFDQAVGQRRAAHLDERLVRAQRVVVDRVRDQLLAGARLARG